MTTRYGGYDAVPRQRYLLEGGTADGEVIGAAGAIGFQGLGTGRNGRQEVAESRRAGSQASGVAAASASTRARRSGRESIGWCPVGNSTTFPALLAYSRCASGGVARSSAHTT
jgi:hypothetical protein